MTTNIGTTSAATLSQSGGLGTIDATITGGESPTEAEHNALRADVAMLRIWAAAVHAALIAVG
jgi:hypothetical protein